MVVARWLQFAVLSGLFVTSFGTGGCVFPPDWTGRWFQSGLGSLALNTTHFGVRGECVMKDGDKYVVIDRTERELCKRCIAVYKRHDNVIQYKESNCLAVEGMDELCMDITGDQPLLTLFKANDAATIPCPFKSPPFRFSYNRGKGDCATPPSRIDACTDDSKLLMTFAACPDVPGTESGVEELSCLATWKEGNSHYLVAKMRKEPQMMLSEEDLYRCLMYRRASGPDTIYQMAQSGDATCSTVTSSTEGSRTMLLTKMESSHERCKFPHWVVNTHHWHSLDNAHSYHFSHKNATLRVTRDHGPLEMRIVCHHIVANASTVVLVAHATAGCKNGHICMVFHKRDNGVIQVQQSSEMVQEPSEACVPPFTESYMSSPITLIKTSLDKVICPHPGQYTTNVQVGWGLDPDASCHTNTSLFIGCLTSPETMTFQACSPETLTAYHCYGTWSDNHTTYLIASPVSRKSTDAKRYCFIFTQKNGHISLDRLSDSCNLSSNRVTSPLNLTLQGSCRENSGSGGSGWSVVVGVAPSVMCLQALLLSSLLLVR